MRDDMQTGREADLEREGDAAMGAKAPARALSLFEEAAAERECPSAQLCLKAARAALAAGAPERAAPWCMRVVDADASYSEWVIAASLFAKCPPEAIPARRSGLKVALVATWTTKTFAPLLVLAAARCGVQISIWEAEYGQYFHGTLQSDGPLFSAAPDTVILLPDARALGLSPQTEADCDAVAAEAARWMVVWDGLRAGSNARVVQLGFANRPGDIFGNFAAGFGGAVSTQTITLNRHLAEAAAAKDIAFVDVDRLAARHGAAQWFDDRAWYMAKIPYSPIALCRLALETAVVLAAQLGLSRRCLVLDLDNTLWGGVIGDDGLGGIRLGEGVEGEAFVDFQHALKALTLRGVLLAVCSKNEEAIAREPFERHPEMVLRPDDITAFVANWQPKSENIARIARTLDLGLESLTFFDDNPYEREEVRRRAPAVDVPVLPDDPTGYRSTLEAYPYFEPSAFTTADAARGKQYRARAEANALRETAGSLEDYQKSLGMVARIGPIDDLNMARVVQLINKTNQFNLTTRRRNRAELEAFMADPGSAHFWVRLEDRFADHGLIAVVLCRAATGALEIDSLLMSCRVLGRGVEELILREVAAIADARGLEQIRGLYIPTERNAMVANLYQRQGFVPEEGTEDVGTIVNRFTARPADLPPDMGHIRTKRVANPEPAAPGRTKGG